MSNIELLEEEYIKQQHEISKLRDSINELYILILELQSRVKRIEQYSKIFGYCAEKFSNELKADDVLDRIWVVNKRLEKQIVKKWDEQKEVSEYDRN